MVMRVLIGGVALALSLGAAAAQERGADDDPYSTDLVRQLIELARMGPGRSISFLEKRQNRLGDRVSIAILKLHTPMELRDPQNVAAFIPVIRGAFEVPCLICRPADRNPAVTVLLLNSLAAGADDAAVKQKLLEAVSYVERAAAAECGATNDRDGRVRSPKSGSATSDP